MGDIIKKGQLIVFDVGEDHCEFPLGLDYDIDCVALCVKDFNAYDEREEWSGGNLGETDKFGNRRRTGCSFPEWLSNKGLIEVRDCRSIHLGCPRGRDSRVTLEDD